MIRRLAYAALLAAALSACSLLPRSDAERPAEDEPPPGQPVAVVPGAAGAPAHVVVVSIAGLPALGADSALADAMPTLASLAAQGVSAERVRTVAPASVYPVHASFVTGRRPASHGVPADRLLGERSVRPARYWHASHLQGPSLFEAARDQGVSVAALDWPVTGGADLRWLLPDQRPTRSDESFGAVLDGGATPWVVDYVREHASPALLEGSGGPGPELDALLVGAACALLARPDAPGLLLMRLSQTEPALRSEGSRSDAARAAFADSDRNLRKLLECSASGGGVATTAFVVVGDRTFGDVHTALQLNAVLVEQGLLSATGGETWRAIARSNGASAFVYARGAEEAVEAKRLFEAEAQYSGGFRLVAAEEMISLGADREAWFGITAVPGYAFRDGFAPPIARASPDRGAGGSLELPPDAVSPAFVAWGKGVRAGITVPVMAQLDVAPTLAFLLGLELPEAEGHPLVGLFDVLP